MKFYIGLHIPSHARYFDRSFISISRVRGRKSPVPSKGEWILDSGAFGQMMKYGRFVGTPQSYAEEVNRIARMNVGLTAAVSEDYMCEPFILEKTGFSVLDHQRMTIDRFRVISGIVENVYLIPVIQGYTVREYLDHIDQYGELLPKNCYAGVGSVCKRNGSFRKIETILSAIKNKRPDLRLHGFGVKITALYSGCVRDCLYSADSMAWSFAGRKRGGSANDWTKASEYIKKIETMPIQYGWAI